MHWLGKIVIATGLILSPMASAEPLSPGKPAGVKAAQMTGTEWAVLGGIAALGIGIAIATAGGRSSATNQGQPITIVNTSSTAV